jgi:hypothetical protein
MTTIYDVQSAMTRLMAHRVDRIVADTLEAMDTTFATFLDTCKPSTVHLTDKSYNEVTVTFSFDASHGFWMVSWPPLAEPSFLINFNKALLKRGLIGSIQSTCSIRVEGLNPRTLIRLGVPACHCLADELIAAAETYTGQLLPANLVPFMPKRLLTAPYFWCYRDQLKKKICAQHERWSPLRAAFVASVVHK